MIKFKNIILLIKACAAGYLAYSFLYDHSFVTVLMSPQHGYTLRTANLIDYYGRTAFLFLATLIYLPKLYSMRIALTLAFFAFMWYSKKSSAVPPPIEYLNYTFYVFTGALVIDFLVRYAKNDFGVEIPAYQPINGQRQQDPYGMNPGLGQGQQPGFNQYGQTNDSYGANGLPPGLVVPDSAMDSIGNPILGMDDIFSGGGNETPEELELMEEMNKPPEEWRIIGDKKVNPRNMVCSQNYVLTERIFNEIA